MLKALNQALEVLHQGGVIAYPTEHCFGLGCDPLDQAAVERILSIKQRDQDQGLILIASSIEQIEQYVRLSESRFLEEMTTSWPGPYTWVLPKLNNVSSWISGKHDSVAVRITAHPFCKELCEQFGGAIISTSANRHKQPAMMDYEQVSLEMGREVDYIINLPVGGAKQASQIRDGLTGEILR